MRNNGSPWVQVVSGRGDCLIGRGDCLSGRGDCLSDGECDRSPGHNVAVDERVELTFEPPE